MFNHLSGFLDSGLRCVARDVFECVTAEMCGLNRSGDSAKFLCTNDVANLTSEVKRLANGFVNEHWYEHVAKQRRATFDDRLRIKAELENNPKLGDKLRLISPIELKSWLNHRLLTREAAELLAKKIHRHFPEEKKEDLLIWATELLKNRSWTSSAIVRADYYYYWRCAVRRSNPADLIDDIYHVLNAAYCDIYATSEVKHREYASDLLQNGTRIKIYRHEQKLDEWLEDVAQRG